MEKLKMIMESKYLKPGISILSVLFVIFSISTNNGYLIVFSLIVLVVVLERVDFLNFDQAYRKKRISNRVRYRVQHCELEVLVYSTKFRYFIEKKHPMDELLDIDYKASYKRHYIRASIDEEAFIYHEEALFPTRKIPVVNMFQGFVVDFELTVNYKEKFTINHPLLNERYPKNFVYTNRKLLQVYIPNRRFIEQITETDNVEEKINELTSSIKEIIQFKKEFLITYKEDK